MQPADDVQFRDADRQSFARLLHNFLDGELKSIRVAFLFGERAELATQDAVIRVIDVSIDDVAGAISIFALANEISDCAERVQIARFKKAKRVGVGNAFVGRDFFIDVAEFTALDEEIHRSSSKADAVLQSK